MTDITEITAILLKVIGFFKSIFKWPKGDRRKLLPYSEVKLGDYKIENLSVGILCKIVLNEKTIPSIDEFLKRIKTGEPYCPTCFIPLELIRTSWVANYGQIGYKCIKCRKRIDINHKRLLNIIKGHVRKRFNYYFDVYKKEMKKITKGKDKKYKIR